MNADELTKQLAAALLRINVLERVLFAVMLERDSLETRARRLVRSNVMLMAEVEL